MLETVAPAPENTCFGCGGGNPHGLHLTFELDHELHQVRGRFQLGSQFQGSQGILHGGIIALVLDEAMGKLTRLHGLRAVTAELTIEYLRPIHAGEEINVVAGEQSREGRNLHFTAEIRDARDRLLARGRARFVAIAPR